MPIGASKVGALGGLVPGGSETFNAPGTFSVPPGVKKVSITGAGATGNPGNAGNQGNPGNSGSGAGGGGGAASFFPINSRCSASAGGAAWKANDGYYLYFQNPQSPNIPNWFALGGKSCNTNNNACSGQAGSTGNAGTAGNPGNPGNPGGQSSGLSYTFCGGAGGNAGAGGAAGNGGSGGQAGGGGGSAKNQGGARGNGGNGGGQGGAGGSGTLAGPPSPGRVFLLARGGGGAGAVNGGQTGNSFSIPGQASPQACYVLVHPYGGQDNNLQSNDGPIAPPSRPFFNCSWGGASLPNGMWGGAGGSTAPTGRNPAMGSPSINATAVATSGPSATDGLATITPPYNSTNEMFREIMPFVFPAPIRAQNLFRNGAGGGAAGNAGYIAAGNTQVQGGGAGGGGGRGNAGNAGGPTPTPSGAAATPVTHNCVSVTPGCSYPITVASPGGSIVISWNPQ